MTRTRCVATSTLALACAVLFILQFRGIPRPITLTIDVRTERCARLQFFYDVPSDAGAPEAVMRMMDSRDRFRKLRIPINAAAIRNVRLIQSGGCGTVWLRHIRIKLLGGQVIAIPARDLRPINPAMALVREGDAVRINGGNTDAGVAFLMSDLLHVSRFAEVHPLGHRYDALWSIGSSRVASARQRFAGLGSFRACRSSYRPWVHCINNHCLCGGQPLEPKRQRNAAVALLR